MSKSSVPLMPEKNVRLPSSSLFPKRTAPREAQYMTHTAQASDMCHSLECTINIASCMVVVTHDYEEGGGEMFLITITIGGYGEEDPGSQIASLKIQ